MRQIEIATPGGPEVLVQREAPVPVPRAGEVLLRVAAAGVNRPDLIQRAGRYPVPANASLILGLEVAGEVVALGDDVTAFGIGDQVCALTNGGGYAEYCVAPAGQTLPVPDGMDALHASVLPETFFTVWANLFDIGNVAPGKVVLVHGGTSGIGTTALLLCREFGITAFATAGSDEKCATIAGLGASAINYRMEKFDEAILACTAERGVDIVLDIVGGRYFDQNLRVLARDGTLVLVGLMGGASAGKVNLTAIMSKRLRITGSMMRPRTDMEKSGIARQLRQRVWPALSAGRCWPILHSVYPLDHAAQAHAALEAGEVVGKIALDVGAGFR